MKRVSTNRTVEQTVTRDVGEPETVKANRTVQRILTDNTVYYNRPTHNRSGQLEKSFIHKKSN